MSTFEKDSAFQEEHDEAKSEDDQVKNGDEIFERTVDMPTLPSAFNSLIGKTVKIELEEPCSVIELLGDLLGITDYRINRAAFWFLDTIALHVLRYKDRLDDHQKDKKLPREDFFKEMRMLFIYVAEKLSNGDQLPHWEQLMDEYVKIKSKSLIADNSVKGAEYSVTDKSPGKESMTADDKHAYSTGHIEKNLKTHDSKTKRNAENYSPEGPSNNTTNSLTMKNYDHKLLQTPLADATIEASNLTYLNTALDIITEATYSMYGNEVRYALIHAVFVTPIPMEIYHIRHTLRVPRRIKLADPTEPFGVQLYDRLKKSANQMVEPKDKRRKEKGAARKEMANTTDTEHLPTPLSVVDDEKRLIESRKFILPLIEANEALEMFGIYKKDSPRGQIK